MSTPWQPLGVEPRLVFRAFGMRRSGNHAMANWLLRNAPDGSIFLNNCQPGKSPFKAFRGIEVNLTRLPSQAPGPDLADRCAPAGDGAVLLITYEDTVPDQAGRARAISGDLDEGLIDANLIFYRSFLNWSASLLRKLQGNASFTPLRRSAIVLRAIDDYIRMMSLVQMAEELALLAVCYDRWKGDATFRANVLRDLDLPDRDNSIGPVQSYGGGSSFQKSADTAAALTTDQRWAQMADDPTYLDILRLAARDTRLTEQLAILFPDDSARLQALTS